ncbi:DUF3833 domain-containing protein [Aliidiomarina minuta]|uniref:DUF3833 domain-containing protein n=1 Tax=Aliidiomarina minuta TaxID=880057 RepID=A0A432W6A0_9GAMM|nr:DUF3833 domain-containing protein [Aliidiomarina minuta]RUO25604.1 DUF3833 domain-containing protein [Aliidiomarina minuta]
MINYIRNGLLVLSLFLVVACSASISDYEGETPELKLEEFFNGSLVAHGMVQNRQGKVTQRFTATMEGTWDGNEGVLDEMFYWDDGREEQRVWYLTKTGEKTYEGRASDVVGVAEGQVEGNALHWVYQLEVDIDGRGMTLTLDDWMYLLDEDRIINRTEMRYFGVRVGDITLYIERLDG